MNTPIHVATTRTVKPGCEESFERAILTFFADSQRDTNTLGAQLLRPLPGSKSRTYGILRSFAGEQDHEAFPYPNLLRGDCAVWYGKLWAIVHRLLPACHGSWHLPLPEPPLALCWSDQWRLFSLASLPFIFIISQFKTFKRSHRLGN